MKRFETLPNRTAALLACTFSALLALSACDQGQQQEQQQDSQMMDDQTEQQSQNYQ